MPPLRRLAPLLLIGAIASCGGGADGSRDPAAALPGDTPLYLETTVRPGGDERAAVEALAEAYGIEDPVQTLLDQLGQSGTDGTTAADLEPWLGERVGVAVGDFGTDPPVVGAAAVEDAGAARDFLEEELGGEERRHRSVDYRVGDEVAAAVTEYHLLFAEDEPDLRRLIDATEAGEATLADAGDFRAAVGDLPGTRVATAYLAADPVVALIERDPRFASGLGPAVIDRVYGNVQSISAAVTPQAARGVLDVHVRRKPGTEDLNLFSALGDGTPLAAEAPADALAVYGLADLGELGKGSIDAFDDFVGDFGGIDLARRIRRTTGLDLERDVLSWVGDAALFLRGPRTVDLTGAVMIDATDERAAAAALPRLAAAATVAGLPLRRTRLAGADQAWATPVTTGSAGAFLARRGGRVVVGYGEESTRLGLRPSTATDDDNSYENAKLALDGRDPTAILDARRLVALRRLNGSRLDDAARYFEPLALLAAGSTDDGDTQRIRVAATTR